MNIQPKQPQRLSDPREMGEQLSSIRWITRQRENITVQHDTKAVVTWPIASNKQEQSAAV